MAVEYMSIVYRADLEPTLKSILLAIANHCDENGICYPPVRLIAWETGYSRATVIAKLREANELSYIVKTTQLRNTGSQSVNLYQLVVDKLPIRREDYLGKEFKIQYKVASNDHEMSEQKVIHTPVQLEDGGVQELDGGGPGARPHCNHHINHHLLKEKINKKKEDQPVDPPTHTSSKRDKINTSPIKNTSFKEFGARVQVEPTDSEYIHLKEKHLESLQTGDYDKIRHYSILLSKFPSDYVYRIRDVNLEHEFKQAS